MELTLLTPEYAPLGTIERVEGDIEIGGENDFMLALNRVDYEPLLKLFQGSNPNVTSIAGDMQTGARFAVLGTEWGGFIGKDVTDTAEDTYELGGMTYRGYLKQKIISPKSGQDYYVASGDVRTIIYNLLNGDGSTGSSSPSFLNVIGVQSSLTGKSVSNYQFNRYTNMYDGITKMLASVGYKMEIKNELVSEMDAYGTKTIIKPIIYIVPIEDYSNSIVLSQNNKYNFNLSRAYDGVNHLICLGQGELKDRTVIHLFANKAGTISNTQSIFGAGELISVYDFSSVESVDQLRTEGTEHFLELMSKEEFSMSILSDDFEANIGDYIGGKDYLTGYFIKQPITKKIMNIASDGTWSVEYSIEGNEIKENEY